MSLINDMLRDLDARKADQPAQALSGAGRPAPVSSAQPRYSRAFVVIAGALMLAIAVLAWLEWQAPVQRPDRFAVAPVAVSPVVPQQQLPAAEPGPESLERLATAQTEPVQPHRDEPVAAQSAGTEVSVAPPQTAQQSSILAEVSAARTEASPEQQPTDEPRPAPVMRIAAVTLSPEEQDARAVAAARSALDRGNPDRAVSLLRDRLRADHGATASRAMLAELYLRTGRNAEAASLLDAGLKAEPEHVVLRKLYARLLIGDQQWDQARQSLQRQQPLLVDDAEYHALLALAESRSGMHVLAAERYQGLLASHPPQAAWWIGLAVSSEAIGNRDSAIQAYRAVLALPDASRELQAFASERQRSLLR